MRFIGLSRIELYDTLALTALALLIRAATATWTGLTPDEANGVLIAMSGSWAEMVQHLKEDGNAPLLYVIIRIFSNLLGPSLGASDAAVKILAVAIAAAQIPITYLILRRMLNRTASLQAAILLALCPPLVHYGTLIRSYALISIFSLVSTWSLTRLLSASAGKKWVIVYGLSTACLVYGHYWGGFVAIGQLCLVACGAFLRWFDRGAVIRFFCAVALAVLAFSPWLPAFHFQLTHIMRLWDQPLDILSAVTELVSYVLVGTHYSASPADQLTLIFSTVLVVLALASPVNLATPDFDGRQWKIVTACGFAAGIAYSLLIPVMRDRYLTPFAPLLVIVFVSTYHALVPAQKSLWRRLAPIAIWLPIWIPQLLDLATTPDTTTVAIIDVVNKYEDRKKDLVLVAWPIISPAIDRYLPADMNVISYPDLKRIQINTWDGLTDRMRDPAVMTSLFATLSQTLRSGGRIWLIDRARKIERRDCFDNSLVRGLPYFDLELCRMDQIRSWLALNSRQLMQNQLAPGRDFATFLSVYGPPGDQGLPAPGASGAEGLKSEAGTP